MKDNKIIKALECCLTDLDCHKCPYEDYDGEEHCDSKLLNDVLDLINRQKAEILSLQNKVELLEQDKKMSKEDSDKSKAAAMEVIKRQEAEIERLEKDSKRLKKVQMQLDDAMKMYSTIKAEAVKEFAEKSEKELFIKQDEHRKHWEEHLLQHRTTKSYSELEQAVDNWLRGYGEAVQDILSVNNNLVKEMVGDAE